MGVKVDGKSIMFTFIKLVSLRYQNLAALKDDRYELSFNPIIIHLSFLTSFV